jgi:hypothetical protein
LIVSRTSLHAVFSVAAENQVTPRSADQPVMVSKTLDPVIASESANRVMVSCSDKTIWTVGTDDGAVTGPTLPGCYRKGLGDGDAKHHRGQDDPGHNVSFGFGLLIT